LNKDFQKIISDMITSNDLPDSKTLALYIHKNDFRPCSAQKMPRDKRDIYAGKTFKILHDYQKTYFTFFKTILEQQSDIKKAAVYISALGVFSLENRGKCKLFR
jgi:hypothetical protein